MFKNDYYHIETELNQSGYAVIDLLPPEVLHKLNSETDVFIRKIPGELLSDTFLSAGRIESDSLRNESYNILRNNITEYLYKIFADESDIITGVHLLKSPGKSSALNPHQDSSLIDETKYTSYYAWVPFQDTSYKNGTMCIIPGSHRLNIRQRSLNIPWNLGKFENKLWNYMIPVDMKAGQAMIFHSALIHASSTNKSDKIRIAANFFIKPKGALYSHYYADKTSEFKKIEVYHVNEDFYLSEDIMKRPPEKYKLLRTEPNMNQDYTIVELEKIFINNQGILDKLNNFINKIPILRNIK